MAEFLAASTCERIVIAVTLLPGTIGDHRIVSNPGTDVNRMKIKYFVLAIALSAVEANADNSTLDAAIGGGIGGAAGAAIGNEIGGRDGAILGGALGGAIGVAVNTDEHSRQSPPPERVHHRYLPPPEIQPYGYHCPPGQRKKGNC
jgi:hypothetical protein